MIMINPIQLIGLLDYNKVEINDDENLFSSVFRSGPGFQMAQLFVENIFEAHVDWEELIENDSNYKNIFQVKIQKEFKTTPDYLEIEHDPEIGYNMGVYICLNQQIHTVSPNDATDFSNFGCFEKIQEEVEKEVKLLIFMGSGTHKIKKKAEQIACEEAIRKLNF